MILKDGIKLILSIFMMLVSVQLSQAQIVEKGIITYERRTNIGKQFKDAPFMKNIPEKDKIRKEQFSLAFNDSVAKFSFIEPDVEDPMSWATIKNSVYTNLNQENRKVYMDLMGSTVIIDDSLAKHTWILTDRTREIAGFNCTRAIWKKNDSTNIYAWFTTDISPSIGPESIRGLPGAVLGLATEDGGVVYFATKVEKMDPSAVQLEEPKKKGKKYTEQELRDEMTEKLGGQPFGKRIIEGMFQW
jgi:GLPGLI family protein